MSALSPLTYTLTLTKVSTIPHLKAQIKEKIFRFEETDNAIQFACKFFGLKRSIEKRFIKCVFTRDPEFTLFTLKKGNEPYFFLEFSQRKATAKAVVCKVHKAIKNPRKVYCKTRGKEGGLNFIEGQLLFGKPLKEKQNLPGYLLLSKQPGFSSFQEVIVSKNTIREYVVYKGDIFK